MKGKMNVWIVDDDQVNNLICKTLLREEDWVEAIEEFTESHMAFETLSSLDGDSMPDVILLDINMPELSGWEFLDKVEKELNLFSKQVNLCVILLTSSIDESDTVKADNHKHVDGMLSKPLNIDSMKKICGI